MLLLQPDATAAGNSALIPSFGRAGRPRKINFSDLFLWDPMIEMELQGISFSRMFGEGNPEFLSLFQDIGRKRKISLKRVKSFIELMAETGFPWIDEFRRALQGDESEIANLGKWYFYIHSISRKPGGVWPPKLSPLGRHFVDIEQALREPTMAWNQDNMSKCVHLLESSTVLAPYLWPEAIARLRNATTEAEITAVRAMVMLELHLSCLACWDAQGQAEGYANKTSFEPLFPDFADDMLEQPNALFFAWLANHSGTHTRLVDHVHQINKRASDTAADSTKRQLRRWKSGKGFASDDMLDALFRSLYGDKASERDHPRHNDLVLSWSMVAATKRINLLMPILSPIRKCREPSFPFGHLSVQEWRESRYPHWYRYWQPLLEKRR